MAEISKSVEIPKNFHTKQWRRRTDRMPRRTVSPTKVLAELPSTRKENMMRQDSANSVNLNEAPAKKIRNNKINENNCSSKPDSETPSGRKNSPDTSDMDEEI